MTELTLVDAAKCPHCREEVSGEELNAMTTAHSEESVLVCPECETMLGGAMGDGMFAGVAATTLGHDLDDVADLTDALLDALNADSPDDVDDEDLELLEDRLGDG